MIFYCRLDTCWKDDSLSVYSSNIFPNGNNYFYLIENTGLFYSKLKWQFCINDLQRHSQRIVEDINLFNSDHPVPSYGLYESGFVF